MLDEFPVALQWGQLVNQTVVVFMVGNDSVTNKGLGVFWGSASCIQLPRALGCLRTVLSEPQIIAESH